MYPMMYSYSGKHLCPLNIQPEDIEIVDIVQSLSNTCRFNGQLPEFYSVAQHSVLVSKLIATQVHPDHQEFIVAGLFHDLAEAYLGDVISPIKANVAISTLPEGHIVSMNHAEDLIMDAFNKKYGTFLPFDSEIVKRCDKIIGNSESYYIRGYKYAPNMPVIKDEIIPLSPKESRELFFDYLDELNVPELVYTNVGINHEQKP